MGGGEMFGLRAHVRWSVLLRSNDSLFAFYDQGEVQHELMCSAENQKI